MTDPFRAAALTDRLRRFGFFIPFIIIIAGTGLLASRPWDQRGRVVEAEVQEFGIIAGRDGYRPEVTVLMPDGTARRLLGPRMLPAPCRRGDKIEVLQGASDAKLGLRGCYR